MPLGPTPHPAQQVASGFPLGGGGEPRAVSSGDSREDSPLPEVCPRRPHIPDVPTSLPRHRLSLSPIRAGIYGAATMDEALDVCYFQASQLCKGPAIPLPSQMAGLKLRDSNQPHFT